MTKKPNFTNISMSDHQRARYDDLAPFRDDVPLVLMDWWERGIDVKVKRDPDRGSYAIYLTLGSHNKVMPSECLSVWGGTPDGVVQTAAIVLGLCEQYGETFTQVKRRVNKEQTDDLEQYKEFLEYKRRQERQNAPTSGD